jgi:MYXO-CTERM domain-containing protein
MPGATEMSVAGAPDHLVVRATFGLIQTFDGGKTWRWICEQAIGVSGEADPPLTVSESGALILVSPKGGLLVSRDRGCSWAPGPALLESKKTVDLTRDPADGRRVLVVASTVATIDDRGLVAYENKVAETRDGGETWSELAPLPSDFSAETLEVAPSDPRRIYVSGTASNNPLLGVIARSEDGGASWIRSELTLPQGSGSVFVGAIDPADPDRLWIRVPARGDVFGFFPASLLVSADRAQTFTTVAATARAMFGFALSPDGTRLAYGGPFDGLFVGPAAGPFTKVSDLGVRCLKWGERGLYACGSQPPDPFTLGLSPNADGVFEPLYEARTTCPMTCEAGSFQAACAMPWSAIGPAIGAPSTCDVPWSDAGSPDAGAVGGTGGTSGTSGSSGQPDASSPQDGGGATPGFAAPVEARGGCACELAPPPKLGLEAALALLSLTFIALRRRAAQRVVHSTDVGSSKQR